jgi:hypothetical protein
MTLFINLRYFVFYKERRFSEIATNPFKMQEVLWEYFSPTFTPLEGPPDKEGLSSI